MALFAEVGHGECAALDVVDADAAEAGPAVAVDEHDGDASRASPSSGAVSWSTGVTSTPRTRCCEQQLEVVALTRRVAVAVAR